MEMALALLKRNDANLVQPVACDAPADLAVELSAQHQCTVEVAEIWPSLAGRLDFVQQMLWPLYAGNGWFRASVPDAVRMINAVQAFETTPPQSPEPVAEGLDSGSDSLSAGGHKPFTVDPLWHKLLQECPRAQADKATTIRKGLKRMLGPVEAAALLSNYKESALRLATGGCQRFIVNAQGVTMKLVDKTVAAT